MLGSYSVDVDLLYPGPTHAQIEDSHNTRNSGPIPLLFSNSVCMSHRERYEHGRYIVFVRQGRQFIVLIREDLKAKPFADEITKAALIFSSIILNKILHFDPARV